MQAQMQEKVEKLQGLQKTQQKTLMARQTLDSQISENKLVKDELDGLEEDAKVFKLIGPALIRQETAMLNKMSIKELTISVVNSNAMMKPLPILTRNKMNSAKSYKPFRLKCKN